MELCLLDVVLKTESMRFRQALLAAMLSASLLPFAALSILQLQSLERQQAADDARQSEAASAAAQAVGREVQNAARLVRAASLAAGAALNEAPSPLLVKSLQETLKQLAEASPLIINLHIDGADLRSLVFWPPATDAGVSNLNQDHSARWHAGALSQPPGTLLVSPVFRAQGGYTEATVGLAAPIAGSGGPEGRNRGVASAVLDLAAVGRIVEQIEVQAALPGLVIWVLDQNGRALNMPISSTASGAGARIPGWPSFAAQPALESKGGGLESVVVPGVFLSKDGGTGLQSMPASAAMAPLPAGDAAALPWKVLALRPDGVRSAALKEAALQSAVGAGVLLLLMLGAAWFFSDRLSRAADQLLRHVASRRAEPAPENAVRFPAELRLVQHAYADAVKKSESQSAALRRLNEALEEKVALRTADLARKNETLGKLFESMAEGFMVLSASEADGALRVLRSNREARLMLGEAAEEGAPASRFLKQFGLTSLPPAGMLTVIKAADASGFAGGQHAFEALQFPLEDGRSAGLLLRDVTAREADLKMKDALVGMVAHELRTPIAAIRLETEALQTLEREGSSSDAAGWEAKAEALADLAESSRALQSLVDDWLDVARIEGGAFVIERHPLQLPLVARKALKRVRARYPDLQAAFAFDEDAQVLIGDAARLEQLFENLFSNAARYGKSGEPPRVAVRAQASPHHPDCIEISVEDCGIGIEPSEADRLFDRFWQSRRVKRRAGGTGLGLYIARAIAASHGGSIRAEPKNAKIPQAGARFVIELPRGRLEEGGGDAGN